MWTDTIFSKMGNFNIAWTLAHLGTESFSNFE